MLRHNLLLAFRNFLRYKNSFIINLVGLSTGLACTLLIYLWVNDELSVNKFHEKDDRLFQVMEFQQYDDEIMTTTSTPGILAETLALEIPEIEYAATTTWVTNFTLSFGQHNVNAEGFYVGKDYFKIFSYGLIYGDPGLVLKDKNAIIISEELALKLFDTAEDILGKQVALNHDETYLITGVFKGTPRHSSTQFDFVLSFEKFKDNNSWVMEWGNNGPSTYVTLNEGADADFVSDKIAEFIVQKREESHVTLFLRKYSEGYLYGRYEDGKLVGGRIEYVQLFSVIAIFILIIACINFMNLSTARASRRAKEVGIKKAVGAFKRSLVWQYLAESTLVTVGSLIIAFLIIWLFLPEFNEITSKQIELSFGGGLIFWSFVIAVFTGLISGSYPALYLSSFKPLDVIKGTIRGSVGELWARRGLVVFQFTMSVILIIAVLVIYRQIQFVQTKNLGYDNDNVVFFEVVGAVEQSTETFLDQLRKVPGVQQAGAINHNLLHRMNNTMGLKWEGKDPDSNILFENVRISHGLLETVGIEIIEGRAFSPEFATDTAKVIFNEAAIKVMNMENPIGKVIRLWDEIDLEIVGVAKDFHFQSLREEVNPLFFRLDDGFYWNVMMKIKKGSEKQTLDAVRKFYTEFNPGFSLEYNFMDQEYANLYEAEQRVASLSQYFAGFAVLISCLGLFGLAAFTAERRIKEIGIRKALGSSVQNIILLLTKDFTRLVLIAIIIAIPISYMLIGQWLLRFAYRIELSWTFFLGAGLIAIVIAWVTVGIQALKAARVNPSKSLRSE